MADNKAPHATTADAQSQTVIHDIGFRHYDGPRLGRGWIVRSLLVETFRGVFGFGRPAKAKIMPWILVGIMLAPPLIFALIAVLLGLDELPMSYTAYLPQMSFVVSLFVASRAPYCVSRDLRHGVMPLYLSRPMRRNDYVLAKFAGLALAMFAVLAASEVLLFIGALLAKLPVGAQITGFLQGLVVAILLSLVLAAIGLVLAAFTPRRGLGVAAIITVLVVISGFAAVVALLLIDNGSETLGAYLGALDPFALVDSIAVSWFGVESAFGREVDLGVTGGLAFTAAATLIVAGGIGLLLRRYKKVGVA
ncbi:ABC transporter permease [Demequina sp. TTPB684]|uniref:ABC transporter permease n=1 Tax=unclassified Demequina TaxID=2620311 RepID=UPI001CF29170|nr:MULTISPECIES: ABC transporter permease [unclassified Demequina]MCB2413968.1 ABC transporter permease [Demequina sp. TTPB684]UPU88679.1 ABC transporter permease [Demequina sp. TMPB413]